MVRYLLPFGIHIPAANPLSAKDSLSFFIIAYSARRRGLAHAQGGSSLLDKILRDATMYFLAIFTGQLLTIFFEIFAPVSDRPTNPRPLTHDESHIGTDSTSPCGVSNHLEYFDEDESDGVLSRLQWDGCVSVPDRIEPRVLDRHYSGIALYRL